MYNLYNGDFVEKTKENIKNNTIDCIISDPPFGVEFKNDIYDDSEDYIMKNIDSWYKEWYRILKDDCYLFLYVGVKNLHVWISKGIEHGFNYKNIVAVRNFNNGRAIPKNNFGSQFQPILVFSKGKGKKFNEVDFIPTSTGWYKDKRNKNPKPYTYVYPNWIKSEWTFATAKRANKNLHPNEKNVDLIKFLIEISTKENETVFDSFFGSCSTGVAALKSKRNFIGIELDNKYYNLGNERLEKCLK